MSSLQLQKMIQFVSSSVNSEKSKNILIFIAEERTLYFGLQSDAHMNEGYH